MDQVDLALERFGLGARPGDRERVGDPVRWLSNQVSPAAAYPASLAGLAGSSARQVAAAGQELDARKRSGRAALEEELKARLQVAFTTDTPFAERWVRHFSNQFTVSTRQLTTALYAGSFEREVVRTYAFGRFSDMLLASTQHPAMLAYLDNQRSVGPQSAFAQRAVTDPKRGKDTNKGTLGLNENLAREVLELHALGADGGYTQDDVRSLAVLITGWGSDTNGKHGGGFYFDRSKHQPGTVTILGKRYGDGLDEGVRAIRDIAAHPSVARNVARRLARHFRVSDPSAIAKLEAAFLDTDGRLDELARVLISLPAAWSGSGIIRTPDDWLTALVRASGSVSSFLPAPRGKSATVGLSAVAGGEKKGSSRSASGKRQRDSWTKTMRSLGQLTWSAASPEGFPDDEASWTGPEQLVRRVEVAAELAAGLVRAGDDAFANVQATLVPRMSEPGRKLFDRAGDRATALTLAFCAPEVLRR